MEPSEQQLDIPHVRPLKTPDLEVVGKHGESISSFDPNLNISSDMSEASRESGK